MGGLMHPILATAVACIAVVGAVSKAYFSFASLSGPLALFFLLAATSALSAAAGVFFFGAFHSSAPTQELGAHLHWNPDIQRRGIGELLQSVNHVALIVSDVGRSLAFYTEIIGFQQIQRPNFDRHGAWLTMGNTELHLIKGVPNAPSGKDLIVSHIALETDYPSKVLEKLRELDVPFRQNISVPDPKKARENKVECFENADGKITQYFIRDPDGYYWELCNCDVLTRFCLFKEGKEGGDAQKTPKYLQLMNAFLGQYNESGEMGPQVFRCPQLFKVGVVVTRLVRRMRQDLKTSFEERLAKKLEDVETAEEADPIILQNFLNRQKTYCDATQGFTKQQLVDALCVAGNSAPIALLILAKERQHQVIFHPPQYLLSEGGIIKQQVFKLARRFSRQKETLGTEKMFASKPFLDNNRNSRRASATSMRSSVGSSIGSRCSWFLGRDSISSVRDSISSARDSISSARRDSISSKASE